MCKINIYTIFNPEKIWEHQTSNCIKKMFEISKKENKMTYLSVDNFFYDTLWKQFIFISHKYVQYVLLQFSSSSDKKTMKDLK